MELFWSRDKFPARIHWRDALCVAAGLPLAGSSLLAWGGYHRGPCGGCTTQNELDWSWLQSAGAALTYLSPSPHQQWPASLLLQILNGMPWDQPSQPNSGLSAGQISPKMLRTAADLGLTWCSIYPTNASLCIVRESLSWLYWWSRLLR